jgi:hypothetical protein
MVYVVKKKELHIKIHNIVGLNQQENNMKNTINKIIEEWVMSETDECVILGLHLMCYQTGNNNYSKFAKYQGTPNKVKIIETLPLLYNIKGIETVDNIKLILEPTIYSYLDWDDVILNKAFQN